MGTSGARRCLWGMRALLLGALLLAAPGISHEAAAQPAPDELERPDGTLIRDPPAAIQTYDEAAARRRITEIERALPHLRHPFARANALLDRATLGLARSRHQRIAAVVKLIALDEAELDARRAAVRQAVARRGAPPATPPAREPDARTQEAAKREIARLNAAAAQTLAAANAELLALLCDPADRGRGGACRTPPALRAWPDLDEALYRLAWALGIEKRLDDEAAAYRRILTETPRSRHRTIALVEVADHAFEQADLATAESLYRAVAADPAPAEAVFRAYATYRLAFVHLNRGRSAEAFATLAAVPAIAGTGPRSHSLVRAVRWDLVRVFATFGAPESAFDAFERAAPGLGLELTVRLAQSWAFDRRSADAVAAYRELVRRAPADRRRCDWQIAIVDAADLGRDAPAPVAEVEELAAFAAALHGQPAAAQCVREAGDAVLAAAHKELRRARRRSPDWIVVIERAERLLGTFVRVFPDAPEHADARLRRAGLAELIAEAAKGPEAAALWRRAAVRFDEALQTGRLDPDERKRALTSRDRARQRASAP